MGIYAPIPSADDVARTNAILASKAVLCIAPLSYLVWMTNSMAVHNTSLGLYTFSSVTNVFLSIIMLIFHTLGNARARELITKVSLRLYCYIPDKPK